MQEIIVITELKLREIIQDAVISGYEHLNHQEKPTGPKYLSTQEAANLIKKSVGALRQLVYQRKIPSYKLGISMLFLEEDLLEWIGKGRRDCTSKF